MLFVPGNNPGMLISAPILGADCVIFDLEDAVAQNEKDAACILVGNALNNLNFGSVEAVVRINGLDTPFWRSDIAAIVSKNLSTVLVPKCDSPELVCELAAALAEEEDNKGLESGSISIMSIVESAIAVENCFQIAKSHPRMSGLLLGAEDLTADLCATRTLSGEEIAYARGRVVVAARAAGIDAIDTPFTNVDNHEGLRTDAALGKQMGFSGKALISPAHVRIVRAIFSPSSSEIDWATKIMAATEQAKIDGKGAFSVDGAMVDGPIIKRAQRILTVAEA
ncbi:CoA ester lyase [Rhodobacteraceae bacterium RKSG542]|nr:CoA ester lyase [Pseudovibrio flavus]